MATKRLALQLGFCQKRVDSKYKEQNEPNTSEQEFDFILVLDFESTCWENPRPGVTQEVIEFPVVLLELASGKVLAEFQQYVMPMEQPILSSFCTKLTGITQDQVENSVPLATCLALFTKWIREMSDVYKFSFNDKSSRKVAAFATWSDWDLGVCLHYECLRKQMRKPEFFNQWIDIRATYRKFYERKPQGLNGALQDLGIIFEGREHSGICDSRNTATLISRMVRDKCHLTITKKLETNSNSLKGSVKKGIEKFICRVKSKVAGKRDTPDELNTNKTPFNPKNDQINLNSNSYLDKVTSDEANSIFKIPNIPTSSKHFSNEKEYQCKNSSLPILHLKSKYVTTPNQNNILCDFNHFKKTPPLCICGKRAKLLLASRPGPNQGRYFFTCPKKRDSDLKGTCKFFKWENNPFESRNKNQMPVVNNFFISEPKQIPTSVPYQINNPIVTQRPSTFPITMKHKHVCYSDDIVQKLSFDSPIKSKKSDQFQRNSSSILNETCVKTCNKTSTEGTPLVSHSNPAIKRQFQAISSPMVNSRISTKIIKPNVPK